ncbi:MAG: beta-galactosidase [Candidatus Spechtbacterales bacterium]|nr:beta-galactosidase [Candidatus Spechtbacterales bacterium]
MRFLNKIKNSRFWKIFFGVLLVIYTVAVALYAWIFVGTVEPAENITWGVNFSDWQAEQLGLDWKETYTTLLDEGGVRHVRIPIYWNELEAEQNVYDFSKWDWQLDELEKRGGKAILAVGYKLPRWPECRIPEWFSDPDPQNLGFTKELFQMIRVVVNHYKDHPAVEAWQVENEPLLVFGVCPETDPDVLDLEIELVRQLDPSRPVIVTDTGEWSIWYEAGKRADIVGSTLYRVIHDPTIGYVEYDFIEPRFYAQRKKILNLWKPNTDVIVTELQAEPWVTVLPLSENSIETQYATMSPERFRDTIQFARNTGLDTFYLWGGEWIVWLKENGHTEIWNEAKALFEESR